jgi:hypothetical protein
VHTNSSIRGKFGGKQIFSGNIIPHQKYSCFCWVILDFSNRSH